MSVEKLVSLFELVKYKLLALLSVKTREECESVKEYAVLVNGDYLGKSNLFAESKVFGSASGSYVNDSTTVGVGDLVPKNYLVSKVLLSDSGKQVSYSSPSRSVPLNVARSVTPSLPSNFCL